MPPPPTAQTFDPSLFDEHAFKAAPFSEYLALEVPEHAKAATELNSIAEDVRRLRDMESKPDSERKRNRPLRKRLSERLDVRLGEFSQTQRVRAANLFVALIETCGLEEGHGYKYFLRDCWGYYVAGEPEAGIEKDSAEQAWRFIQDVAGRYAADRRPEFDEDARFVNFVKRYLSLLATSLPETATTFAEAAAREFDAAFQAFLSGLARWDLGPCLAAVPAVETSAPPAPAPSPPAEGETREALNYRLHMQQSPPLTVRTIRARLKDKFGEHEVWSDDSGSIRAASAYARANGLEIPPPRRPRKRKPKAARKRTPISKGRNRPPR